MSDRTIEISTAVKGVAEKLVEANGTAQKLMAIATTKAETAHLHGWHGVAANIEMATQALERAIEQLTAAQQAGQSSAGTLDQISDRMSSPEVVANLATVLQELDTAHAATQASATLIDEAGSHAQTAGQESLPLALSALHREVTSCLDVLNNGRADVAQEGEEAKKLPGDDDAGGESAAREAGRSNSGK